MLNSVFAALFAVSTIWPFWHITPHQRMLGRAQQSIVRIVEHEADGSTGTCTGFVVLPGMVLTARHCIGPAETADGLPAQLLAVSVNSDIALFITNTPKPPVRWSAVPPSAHDAVTGIGYGNGRMTALTVRVLAVDAFVPEWELSTIGMITAPGWEHGMSGGPIFNQRGEVVGMVSAISGAGERGIGPQTPDLIDFLLKVIESLQSSATPATSIPLTPPQ